MSGWGKVVETVIRDWSEGLQTSPEPDQVPLNGSPLALNCALRSIGAGNAAIEQRRGIRRLTRLPIDSSLIRGQAVLRTTANAQYHVCVSGNGRARIVEAGGEQDEVGFQLTASTNAIDSAVAGDWLYVCDGNAVTLGTFTSSASGAKTNGLTASQWGIVRPAAAPTLATSGGGSMTGTYEIGLSYYNSVTGHESSLGPTAELVASSHQIAVSWTAPSDPQVTDVRVHLRKGSLGVNFYQVAEVAVPTLSTTLNIADSAYNALITLSPETDSNDPPPAGIKLCAWHRNRMFVSDGVDLYYSALGDPESFDPLNLELVGREDGQSITALFSVNDLLLVFKERSLYALDGVDPNTWTLKLLDRDTGCVSHRSVVTAEGLTYWWSQNGPIVWDGAGAPIQIGTPLIAASISSTALNYGALAQVQAAVDLIHERIIWAVPELGHTRATEILAWNYRLQRWESEWQIIDVGSLGVSWDSNEVPWVYLGGYNGHLYRLWDADNDGVSTGTSSGSFVAATSTISQITSTGFASADAVLQDLYVIVESTDGVITWRRRITSATATTLTLESSVGPLAIGATYRWYIGAIDWQFETAWVDDKRPFYRKRYEFAYVHGRASSEAIPITLEIYTDWASTPSRTRQLTFSGAAVWDSALWDVDLWGNSSAVFGRVRVADTGKVWKLKIRSRGSGARAILYKVGMRGEILTDKR